MTDPRHIPSADELLAESEDLQRRMVDMAGDLAGFADRLVRLTAGLQADVARKSCGEGPGDGRNDGT